MFLFSQPPSSDYEGPFLDPSEPVITLALVAQLKDWFTDHEKIPIQLLYTILIQVPSKFYISEICTYLYIKCFWSADEPIKTQIKTHTHAYVNIILISSSPI